jgi:hypothetical protein
MVNLVVAIIVSDIEELKKEGVIQDIINKAYHIISHGNISSLSSLSCTFRKVEDSTKQEWKNSAVDICVHSICFTCNGMKVSPSVKDKLLDIVNKRNNVQPVKYKYGASAV